MGANFKVMTVVQGLQRDMELQRMSSWESRRTRERQQLTIMEEEQARQSRVLDTLVSDREQQRMANAKVDPRAGHDVDEVPIWLGVYGTTYRGQPVKQTGGCTGFGLQYINDMPESDAQSYHRPHGSRCHCGKRHARHTALNLEAPKQAGDTFFGHFSKFAGEGIIYRLLEWGSQTKGEGKAVIITNAYGCNENCEKRWTRKNVEVYITAVRATWGVLIGLCADAAHFFEAARQIERETQANPFDTSQHEALITRALALSSDDAADRAKHGLKSKRAYAHKASSPRRSPR